MQQQKIGGIAVRGIELVLLTPETAALARENGEIVYDDLASAQAAVVSALVGKLQRLRIPFSLAGGGGA